MPIPKRLEMIASLISDHSRVIDVGCDHALLDIYLVQKYKDVTCIATDISKEVYKTTKQTIAKLGLQDRITVALHDGLHGIPLRKDDILVLAGMGTTTILDILKKQTTDRMIILSHNDLYTLRKEITRKGFIIQEELVVLEKEIDYIIIDFVRGNKKYQEEDFRYGPILRYKKEEQVQQYFKRNVEKLKKILLQLPEDHFKKETIQKEIAWIEENIINKN